MLKCRKVRHMMTNYPLLKSKQDRSNVKMQCTTCNEIEGSDSEEDSDNE